MKIGVDATTWGNKRGYGRFVRSLLTAMVRVENNFQYSFFMDSKTAADSIPGSVDIKWIQTSRATIDAAASESSRSIGDMLRVGKAISGSKFDVLLFPTVYSYVPVFSRAKKIVMIYDIIAEKYPELTLPTGRDRFFWKLKVNMGKLQADAVVTISEYSRQGISEYYRIPKGKIHVVNGASDPIFQPLDTNQFSAQRDNLGIAAFEQRILYVGGFGPHKNLHMLLECFARLREHRRIKNTCLVLIGEYKQEVFYSGYQGLKKRINELGLTPYCIFTGFLPDEDLVVLLNEGTVLVLPSLIEGLGLPALEAAACGCPVVATRESPLPGLLGEAGLYIDPRKPEQLEIALERVLNSEDMRSKMRAAGLTASRKLTWDNSAHQMANIIQGSA